MIDGFSAAKGGSRRHQYLLPAACARYRANHRSRGSAAHRLLKIPRARTTMRPPPSRYRHRQVRNNSIIARALRTSHRRVPTPITTSDPARREMKEGRLPAPEDGGINAQPKNDCDTMYIAPIDTAKSKKTCDTTKGGQSHQEARTSERCAHDQLRAKRWRHLRRTKGAHECAKLQAD